MASRRRISANDDIQLSFESDSITTPLASVPLRGANETISSIVSIPAPYNLIVVASHDTRIRVYEMGTVSESPSASECGQYQYQYPYQYPYQGSTYREFAEHTDQVRSLAHLMDDIVVSVGDDRSICTWRASTGKRIARIYLENWILSVARIDSRRFAVGTSSGEMVICSHSGWGRDIRILRYIYKKQTSDWVFEIGTLENSRIATSCTHTKNVTVWDTKKKKSWKKTATLSHDEWIKCVAVSEDYLVTASYNGRLYIYKDDELQCTLNLKHRIQSIKFVENNVLVVLAFSRMISVISVAAKKGLFQITCRNPSTFWAFDILHDGRIVVGGKDGLASVMTPTEEMRAMLDANKDNNSYEKVVIGGAQTRAPVDVEVEGIATAEMETGKEVQEVAEEIEVNGDEEEKRNNDILDGSYCLHIATPETLNSKEEDDDLGSVDFETTAALVVEDEPDVSQEEEEEDSRRTEGGDDEVEVEDEKSALVERRSVRFNEGTEVIDGLVDLTPEKSIVPVLAMEEVAQCGEPAISVAEHRSGNRDSDTGPDSAAVLDADASFELYECKHVELQRWETYGVTRSAISSLASDDLAACFSAFLMHHRASRSAAYIRVKAGLMVLFKEKFVDGDVLVGMSSNHNADTGYVNDLRRNIERTLEAIDGVGKQCGLQYRIDLFFEKLAPHTQSNSQPDRDAKVSNACCGLARLFRRRRNKSD